MNHTPGWQQQQRQFLHYLRHPQTAEAPAGFAPERLAVYANLLYNKFNESLTACFPVIRSILPQDEWWALLLDFIAEHRCRTPYYRRIPDEFVQYLLEERDRPGDRPFLAELAHFEWMELQLAIADAEPVEGKPLSDEQLLTDVPVFAPVVQLLQYRWPVQDIGPAFLPKDAPAVANYILGFRDAGDRVQFIALSPVTAGLIALLGDGLSGRQALQQLCAGIDGALLSQWIQFGLETLMELHRRGAIVDVRSA